MVAKNALTDAADAVDSALQELPDAKNCVRVIATELGHLHAFVGSSRFKSLGPGKRQAEVWEHLSKKVQPQHLAFLFRVEPMDEDEFKSFIREVQLRALSEESPGKNS